jgi:protein-disulfide isomerase
MSIPSDPQPPEEPAKVESVASDASGLDPVARTALPDQIDIAGNRRIQVLAAAVFGALIFVVILVLISGRKDPITAAPGAVAGLAETRALLDGLEQHGLTLGDPRAPVTIVEFVDFQCPFCRAHQLEQQPTVIREVVRTGQARLQVQPLAFLGADSNIARTVFIRLTAKDHGWEFLNLAFWNQGPENSGYVTRDWLKKITADIPGATAADLAPGSDGRVKAGVAEADRLGHALLGPRDGTPFFAVGPTSADPTTYKKVELGAEGTAARSIIAAVRAVG